MPQLRLIPSLAPFAALLLALSLAGCGGGGTDAGPEPVDEGPLPDDGPMAMCGPIGGECLFLVPNQCEASQACILRLVEGDPTPTTLCRVAGVGTDGDDCDPTRPGQCADGFDCNGDERPEDDAGICRPYCCSSTDCAPGQQCLQIQDARGAGICAGGSDCTLPYPQTDNGCDEGQGCYLRGAIPACSTAGSLGEGEDCGEGAFDACAPGHLCIGAAGAQFCRRICDFEVAAEERCAAEPALEGFTCNGFESGGTEFTDIGVCIPPT